MLAGGPQRTTRRREYSFLPEPRRSVLVQEIILVCSNAAELDPTRSSRKRGSRRQRHVVSCTPPESKNTIKTRNDENKERWVNGHDLRMSK